VHEIRAQFDTNLNLNASAMSGVPSPSLLANSETWGTAERNRGACPNYRPERTPHMPNTPNHRRAKTAFVPFLLAVIVTVAFIIGGFAGLKATGIVVMLASIAIVAIIVVAAAAHAKKQGKTITSTVLNLLKKAVVAMKQILTPVNYLALMGPSGHNETGQAMTKNRHGFDDTGQDHAVGKGGGELPNNGFDDTGPSMLDGTRWTALDDAMFEDLLDDDPLTAGIDERSLVLTC